MKWETCCYHEEEEEEEGEGVFTLPKRFSGLVARGSRYYRGTESVDGRCVSVQCVRCSENKTKEKRTIFGKK